MDANETQIRREVFWELYTYDSWQVRSLVILRGSSFMK